MGFNKTKWSCPWKNDQNCTQNSARGGGDQKVVGVRGRVVGVRGSRVGLGQAGLPLSNQDKIPCLFPVFIAFSLCFIIDKK